jgi:uncharacterized protein YndB with AHSA1/START domain
MPNPVKLLKLKPTWFQFIQEVKIDAPPARAWKSLLDVERWWKYRMFEGKSQLKLEPWAGGRFHESNRDGVEALHCFVTYIEPNKLLRMTGQLGLSHLPVNHVFIFELQPSGKGTILRFCQRSHGLMTADVEKGFKGGWPTLFKELKKLAEGKRSKK